MIFFNQILCLCIPGQTPIMPVPLPTKIAIATHEQFEIGWKQLLRGRLSYSWGVIIADHLFANNVPEKEMTPLIWGRKVVKHIFQLMISLWNKRNEEGHLLSHQQESNLTKNRLLLRIESIQQSNPSVMHHHRDFIFRSFDTIMTYSVSNLRSWLRAAENMIRLNNPRQQESVEFLQYWDSHTTHPH